MDPIAESLAGFGHGQPEPRYLCIDPGLSCIRYHHALGCTHAFRLGTTHWHIRSAIELSDKRKC